MFLHDMNSGLGIYDVGSSIGWISDCVLVVGLGAKSSGLVGTDVVNFSFRVVFMPRLHSFIGYIEYFWRMCYFEVDRRC